MAMTGWLSGTAFGEPLVKVVRLISVVACQRRRQNQTQATVPITGTITAPIWSGSSMMILKQISVFRQINTSEQPP
jgi:hypothetical protein